MKVHVRLHTEDDESGRGYRLWASAEDGTKRRWFKWYENDSTAGVDAEAMGLIDDAQVLDSGDRLSRTIRRRLLKEAEIEEEILERFWHGGRATA